MKFKSFFFIFVLLTYNEIYCAEITAVSPINFGTITASFHGDIIQINANFGPAPPFVLLGGKSVVSGGQSGLVVLKPDSPGQMVNIAYPVSIEITNGANKMKIRDFSSNSTQNFVTENTSPVNINIGGVLKIESNQKSGSYSGSGIINIIINNP